MLATRVLSHDLYGPREVYRWEDSLIGRQEQALRSFMSDEIETYMLQRQQ
jgi:hypothetical protein